MERLQMNAKARSFMNMRSGVDRFITQLESIAADAANIATAESQNRFRSGISGRPYAPPRKGRKTTGGGFEGLLHWEPTTASGVIGVQFDLPALAAVAPYWVIQEAGTDRDVRIIGKGAAEYFIPSQVGRRIAGNLAWSSTTISANESGSGSTAGGREQLFLIPPGAGWSGRRRMTIRKEIKGKHFIQAGGTEGFAYFSANIRQAADNIFG